MIEGAWVDLIDLLASTGVVILGIMLRKVINKLNVDEANKEAVTAILDGMALAQEEFVKRVKEASADGKLTKEEAKAARDYAYKVALDLAKGPGREILINMSESEIERLVEQKLYKVKR